MDEEITKIIQNLQIIDKISDIVRLVDPVNKQVLLYQKDHLLPLDFNCYDFWDGRGVCDNCISIRAFSDGETYVKIEYTDEKTYLITAIPIELSDRKIVLEILKDTTSSMYFGLNSEKQTMEIHTIIDHMNRISSKDSLTGIYNRRFINEKLPIDLINCAMQSKFISLIMIDIDYFKTINDRYGHLCGDEILKCFAAKLSDQVEKHGGWTARYGGDEFLICLPGIDYETLKIIAEELKNKIDGETWSCSGYGLPLTTSLGIYCELANQVHSVEHLIGKADDKLYEAKRAGRNRIAY